MKNRKTIYHSDLTTQAVEAVYKNNIVHACGVLLGVCVWGVPWLTVWLWPYFHHALACVMCMHRVFCQLDEALHCTTVCSWFTPLIFNNFWRKIKWHVWLIRRGLVGVQYIKVLKEYIFVYSFPSLLLHGFIFSSLNHRP